MPTCIALISLPGPIIFYTYRRYITLPLYGFIHITRRVYESKPEEAYFFKCKIILRITKIYGHFKI